MYYAKRDSIGGAAAHAIPSMGAIEGKITVLEVVATTALRLLLQSGDKHGAQQVLSSMRKAMRVKCGDMQLSAADSKSAIEYAQQLIEATYLDAAFLNPTTIEDRLLMA